MVSWPVGAVVSSGIFPCCWFPFGVYGRGVVCGGCLSGGASRMPVFPRLVGAGLFEGFGCVLWCACGVGFEFKCPAVGRSLVVSAGGSVNGLCKGC